MSQVWFCLSTAIVDPVRGSAPSFVYYGCLVDLPSLPSSNINCVDCIAILSESLKDHAILTDKEYNIVGMRCFLL